MNIEQSMTSKGKLLVIEDDQTMSNQLRDYYRPRGYSIDSESNPQSAIEHLRLSFDQVSYDAILCSCNRETEDGLKFLRELRQLGHSIPVILISSNHSVERAMQANREGAFDVLSKPINFSYLSLAIERALDVDRIGTSESTELTGLDPFRGIVAHSTQMTRLLKLAKRVAKSNSTVLIHGESGSGKEIVARALHTYSPRSNGPFIALNCSAIPETLLESELFGYAKGAFTGAADRRLGLFEEANGGTLFLDEIGDLSHPLQAKLLRVIQERKIKRLGENQFRPIDVRVLAATHKDLAQEVKEGRFRQDLYFRLAVIKMYIPPLRERKEDIIPLANFFLSKYTNANHRHIKGFSQDAEDYLMSQIWSGNVRELENSIERAVVLCEDVWITRKDLPDSDNLSIPEESNIAQCGTVWSDEPPEIKSIDQTSSWPGIALDALPSTDLPSLEDISLKYVDFVLHRVGGVKERAARILKIDRKTLYRRIEDIHQHSQSTSSNL